VLTIELEDFENSIKDDIRTGRGDFIRLAGGGSSGELNVPDYLLTNWQNFEAFNMFAFCSFL